MANQVKESMEVVGADGVSIGTVDRAESQRVHLSVRAATVERFMATI